MNTLPESSFDSSTTLFQALLQGKIGGQNATKASGLLSFADAIDMNNALLNKRVAILATNGFEQSELEGPLMRHADKGDFFNVDIPLAQAKPKEFDALVLPGGLMNPDELRSAPAAVEFVRAFGESGKPIAAICHAPWVLIEAGLIENRRVTSWPAIKTDVENAGGQWVDEEVVVDNGLVTSRKPDDIPVFNAKVIEEIQEGVHTRMVAASRDH